MIQKQTAIPIAKAIYGARENTILAEKGNRCNNNDNSLVLIDGEDEKRISSLTIVFSLFFKFFIYY